MTFRKPAVAALLGACVLTTPARAAEIEVTHWWTSAGEAAAVGKLARAFDASGNTWVDAAIAGGASAALPVIISRITGGNPMGATMLVHGRQATELIEAGMMLDLTEVAERDNWAEVVQPPSLLASCTVDGRIYCAPTNIHSQQWLWLSVAAFEKAGVPLPQDWAGLVAAAPALEAAGIMPLALGRQPWQALLTMNVLMASLGGPELYLAAYRDRDSAVIEGPQMAQVFAQLVELRALAARARVQDWNEATNLVISGQAAGQIMGDWAQAEFAGAGQVEGRDFACLPGLGTHPLVSTGGNAFYFPTLEDAAATRAQLDLAALMVSPDVQLALNLAKGSLPVRGDLDISAAGACMAKGRKLLDAGQVIPSLEQLVTPDTQGMLTDLAGRFLSSDEMTAEAAQREFARVMADAD